MCFYLLSSNETVHSSVEDASGQAIRERSERKLTPSTVSLNNTDCQWLMEPKDNLNLSTYNALDFFIDQRKAFLIIIGIISVLFAFYAFRLETDPSLKTGLDRTTEAYSQYEKFLETFGSEEFTLIAVKTPKGLQDPEALRLMDSLTSKLERYTKLTEVISLSNVKLFKQKDGVFGSFRFLERSDGNLAPPQSDQLLALREDLPLLGLLSSKDLRTFGIVVRMDEAHKYDFPSFDKLLEIVEQTLKESKFSGFEYRIIGPAFIREAIVNYSIQTGVVFGVLCMLIATMVSIYVFKSFRVTLVTNFILSICVLWVLGLMVMFGIPLNSTTALAFGLVPIATLEIVIHMVVRYHQFNETTQDKIGAIKLAFRWLARPCFMCVVTTAIGFGTLMISSTPMIRQLGFIMSFGVLIAYGLAMIMTPALFSYMRSLDTKEASTGLLVDWLDKGLEGLGNFISRHAKFIVISGVGITAFMFTGVTRIEIDAQVFRMLSESTKTVQDVRFVENNLTPVHTLELLITAKKDSFKNPEYWKNIESLERDLSAISEVSSTDSFLHLLHYLHGVVGNSKSRDDLFADPRLIPQLLFMTSLDDEGAKLNRRYISEDYDKARVAVSILNSQDVPIDDTIRQIRETATKTLGPDLDFVITGELALVSDQTNTLISDQYESMILAAILIVAIMMLQMESVILGLICAVPNVLPVGAVFGIMGWCGIPLDMVTVFSATVAVGMADDNTIHYMTQLKREIAFNPGANIETNVFRAYRFTARQMVSWSLVIIFGFLALLVSPFNPVVSFGILGCASICMGLFGDLIFLPALILSFKPIRNTIQRLCEKGRPTPEPVN